MVYPCFVIHIYISMHFFSRHDLSFFAAGRLSLCRSQPEQAIKYYRQAMSTQSQYCNLCHVSNSEMAVVHLCLWDIKSSLSCQTELEKEATVCEFIAAWRVTYFFFFFYFFFLWLKWLFVYGRVEVRRIPMMQS